MSARPLTRPSARLLNHVEFVYAPGDRLRVRALFEALGFRVLDPQTDPTPADLGPAAGPYLIVFLDAEGTDLIDNVFYASEAGSAQWALESALRERIAADGELAARARAFREAFAALPQAMTHVGVGYPDAEGVREALRRLAEDPLLEGRVTLSGPYEPGKPGSVDDRVVQGFVHTDLVAVGLLLGGQQIELQVRLDGR